VPFRNKRRVIDIPDPFHPLGSWDKPCYRRLNIVARLELRKRLRRSHLAGGFAQANLRLARRALPLKRQQRQPGRSHLAGGLVRRALPLKRQQQPPHAETRRTRRKDWARNGKRNTRRPGRSRLAGGFAQANLRLARRAAPLKRQQRHAWPVTFSRRLRPGESSTCSPRVASVCSQ